MHCKLSKSLARQNASQLTRTPCPVLRKCFVRELVKLTGTRVTLDCRIELSSFEFLELSAKTRKFFGGSCWTALSISSAVVISAIYQLLQLSRKDAGRAPENLTVPDRAFADASFGRDR